MTAILMTLAPFFGVVCIMQGGRILNIQRQRGNALALLGASLIAIGNIAAYSLGLHHH